MRLSVLMLTASALTLGGCLSTPYETPRTDYPAGWIYGTGEGTALADGWWQGFGDAGLDAVVAAVLENNHNLAAAGFRLEQARYQARAAGWNALPTASGSLSATDNEGGAQDRYGAQVSIAYEADLWGRIRATRNASEWEAEATAEDLAATRLSLIGETVKLYWQIAYTRQQIASRRDSLAYAERTRDLIEAQYAAGSVSGIERAEAEQNVLSQTNSLSQLEQQLVENRASLTILLGGQVWPESAEAAALPQVALAEVAPGLPMELLGRRPDLRAAEWRLRASLASVDATRASMYPALSLTASGSTSSSELSDILSDPVGSLGAGLTLPFLNYPQNRLNVAAAKSGYAASVETFRQTLLQALTEVDSTLSAEQKLAAQVAALEQSLRAAETAERLYALRYREGAVALRIWLDAQEQLRSARLSYDAARLSRLNNRVSLYQVLGGGA